MKRISVAITVVLLFSGSLQARIPAIRTDAWVGQLRDSVVFPLLVDHSDDESERKSKTWITRIDKLDWSVDVELLYFEDKDISGADDIFLSFGIEERGEEMLTGPDERGFYESDGGIIYNNGCFLRFVPQEDGSYEVSAQWGGGSSWGPLGESSHGDPAFRWEFCGNSKDKHNAFYMSVLYIYNTFVAPGRFRIE